MLALPTLFKGNYVRAFAIMAGDVLNCPKSFNNSGLLFTHTEENGKLKIWDTSTGVLKQEFTKNFHLNSSCTCLIWLQTSKVSGHKRKKLKQAQNVGDSSEIIAMGSTLGNITLFDVGTNSILTELEGHTSRVNHLTWSPETSSLFSCSDDKYVIEWDIIQHKIKSKWKIDKEKIQCILALSSGKNILSANCSIKLWDLEKKQVSKIFTGHGTEVTSLVEVPNRDGYFVSGAKGDRVLSVWSLNSKEKVVNQVASLILQDPASSIQMINFGTDMTTILYAVTEGGILQVFKHKFNGSLSKPLKPITNISIASEGHESKSRPIAIHGVLPLQNDKVVIAYGNLPFLYFEIISLSENQQENVVLIRQDKRKISVDEFNSKTKYPVPSNDVDYQVPSITSLKRGSKKRLEVPLEERLENLALVNPQSSEGPKKDNMAQLLLQGLQSKDRSILQSVLFRTEQSVIDVTVKNLPVQALTPLIRELTSLIRGKTFTSKCAVNWLTSIVRTHSGILLSNPELTDLFEPLLASIEARVAVLPPLLRLRGRLSLVTQQIGNNMEDNTESSTEPLFTYQEEESSDEGDVEKMSEGSGSDSEDNWDEFPDMGDEKDEDNDERI